MKLGFAGALVGLGLVLGLAAAGALAPLQKGINLQTSDGHTVTATMHGMPVLKNEITSQKSGTLMPAVDNRGHGRPTAFI